MNEKNVKMDAYAEGSNRTVALEDGAGLDDRTTENERAEGQDFIRTIIAEDLETNKYDGHVVTRFPPEPNGFLHIGHAKSICLNFGLAEENGGFCHLRFDDTNPLTEDIRYVEAAKDAIRWLGFDWKGRLFYASDYFEQFYAFAVELIKEGKAYVDSLSEDEIREYRGTVTEPGRDSPYRTRSVEENLDLFERMRNGEFEDGAHVLRAKIDMASPNMKMRDPLLYRIRHATHYRTGDEWCIYPMYDFAHPLSDVIEGITHSICTLEFENNRGIYDWLADNADTIARPYQYEFARLNLDYMVTSKRKMLQLVEEGHVNGWDDPRMLTIAGLRRRGVRPEAIRAFCERIGVAKVNSRVEIDLLEHMIRDDLNQIAPRVLAVLRPLRVVIVNYPEDQVEEFDAPYYPHDVPKEGSRLVPFSRVLYIEQGDFMEEPSRKFHRLVPGREVRLRYAYIIKCVDVIKDENSGEIVELHCTYDPETKGGAAPSGRRVRGTIHWVSAAHALSAEIRLYDHLFTLPNPEEGEEDFKTYLNSNSLEVIEGALIEPSVADDPAGSRYQFERQGYFISDVEDSKPDRLVYNRIVGLRDSWAKMTETKKETSRTSRSKKPKKEFTSNGAAKSSSSKRSKTEIRAQKRAESPELTAKFARYTEELALSQDEADILTGDLAIAQYFEDVLASYNRPKSVANWINNELLRELKESRIEDLPFTPADFAALVELVDEQTISMTVAKDLFAEIYKNGGDPRVIVEKRGLKQVADPDSLAPIIDGLIEANQPKVGQYRAGKKGLLGFFVGQVMRETRGTANPQLVQEMVRSRLDA